MTRRRRNGFDYVAMIVAKQCWARGVERANRAARLARYWAERAREHDRDAYARGYADAERDVIEWQTEHGHYEDEIVDRLRRGEHRKERGDG